MENKSMNNWPRSVKVLATAYLLTLLLGYMISLVQIYQRSGFDIQKAIIHYRGDPSGNETSIHLPQSLATMLSISHVHTLSQPMMFALLGLVFVFTSVSENKKILAIGLSFGGSIVSNMAPWLIRYVSSQMVFLLPLSQVAITVSLLFMTFKSLSEMWNKKVS